MWQIIWRIYEKFWKSQKYYLSLQRERNLFRVRAPVGPAIKAIKADPLSFQFLLTCKGTQNYWNTMRKRDSPFFIAEIHAGKDEQGADEEIDGDAFVEEYPGKEYGDDGVEIDVVGDGDCSQFLDDPVPDKVTERGGDAPQEQEIPQDVGAHEQTERRHRRTEKEIGNHRDQSVEEHFASDEQGVVTSGGWYHQQRIHCPAQAGGKGQRVAQW